MHCKRVRLVTPIGNHGLLPFTLAMTFFLTNISSVLRLKVRISLHKEGPCNTTVVIFSCNSPVLPPKDLQVLTLNL
jgi:hypothetical protein